MRPIAMILKAGFLCAALAATGCSSDKDNGGSDTGAADQGTTDGGADQGTTDIGADQGTPPDGPQADSGGGELVPPVKLVRDKTVCPAGFATPKSGANTGFEVEGEARSFFLRMPDGTPTGPRPLLLYYHGTSTKGDDVEVDDEIGPFADKATKLGFIVVGPNGEMNGSVWPTWDAMRQPDDTTRKNVDLAFFDKLVDCLAAHLEVDEKRIYVSGHSAGGIMTNRVVRERSNLLAAGVVASGIFDLTGPVPPSSLEDMAVLVTWGGDNDEYSGSTGGRAVPKFNFAEQAALASQYYEGEAKVNQYYCRGENLGHKWLKDINDQIVDFLVAHPKGAAFNDKWTLQVPASVKTVTCSEDAAAYAPAVQVTCANQTKPDCQAYCQALGDCVVENETVRPVMADQIAKVGFGGTDLTECGGCVTQCEQDLAGGGGGGSLDETVLACVKTEAAKVTCGSGIQGVMPFVGVINTCCQDQLQSKVCSRLCTTILENSAAATFFTTCAAWAP